MAEFLRAHPWLTSTVSFALLAFGGWSLFLSDPDNLSDTAMALVMIGFVAWCVGLVLVMVLVFRPIKFAKDDAASWEITRAEGRRRYIVRFVIGTLPFFGGIVLALRSDISASKASVVVLLFLGLAIFGAYQFWKYFEYQHDLAAKDAAEDPKKESIL